MHLGVVALAEQRAVLDRGLPVVQDPSRTWWTSHQWVGAWRPVNTQCRSRTSTDRRRCGGHIRLVRPMSTGRVLGVYAADGTVAFSGLRYRGTDAVLR